MWEERTPGAGPFLSSFTAWGATETVPVAGAATVRATFCPPCGAKVLGTGNFFGEDVILRSSTRLWAVFCLTFLDVYTLARDDLHEILADGQFPTIHRSVRRAVAKLAFRRNVQPLMSRSPLVEGRLIAPP